MSFFKVQKQNNLLYKFIRTGHAIPGSCVDA